MHSGFSISVVLNRVKYVWFLFNIFFDDIQNFIGYSIWNRTLVPQVSIYNITTSLAIIFYAELCKISLNYCTNPHWNSCSTFLLTQLIFLFDLPESSPWQHNSRLGSMYIIGVNVGDNGLSVSAVELIMGRTLNGTSFGGQFFFFLLIFFIVVLKLS